MKEQMKHQMKHLSLVKPQHLSEKEKVKTLLKAVSEGVLSLITPEEADSILRMIETEIDFRHEDKVSGF